MKVFRHKNPAYSGYLYMGYYYGIFMLVPYIMFQFTMLSVALKDMLLERKRRTAGILFLGVGIAYLCFAVCSNIENPWGHPLWLCYHLSVGYLGARHIRES